MMSNCAPRRRHTRLSPIASAALRFRPGNVAAIREGGPSGRNLLLQQALRLKVRAIQTLRSLRKRAGLLAPVWLFAKLRIFADNRITFRGFLLNCRMWSDRFTIDKATELIPGVGSLFSAARLGENRHDKRMSARYFRLLLKAACISLAALERLAACQICLPLPMATVADLVIQSDAVVFAREDLSNPYSFKAVDVLKGSELTGDIDLFVDSVTRRRLASDNNLAAVLVRAGETGRWRRVVVADEAYQRIVRRILILAPYWEREEGSTKRCEFFLPLLAHRNRALAELAYLELGRAPYEVIKHFSPLLSRTDIRPLLERPEYLEWRSLAILVLAFTADDGDRQLIKDKFHDCSTFSRRTNLAAWTAAYIETHGLSAVEVIEDRYLSNPQRSANEIEAVLTALAVHCQLAAYPLRDRILNAIMTGLQTHPGAASRIVSDEVQGGHPAFHAARR